VSVEPHALIKASYVCKEKIPAEAGIFFTVDGKTLTRVQKVDMKPTGRVRLCYPGGRSRKQITVDGDTLLVLSMEDLTGRNAVEIFKQAGCASSPFRSSILKSHLSETQKPTTSVLAAMHGANYYG
jgi:hypothetical protein